MLDMGRREFITLISGAAAMWPLWALAQQSEQMRRIGVLMSPREDDLEARTRAGMLSKGLGELGWTEGRNIHIDYRWAGGDAARARANAAELVQLRPDVIIANSTLCLRAVRDETSTIPTVFLVIGDPVGQGFVSSLAHPGGNITGFTAFEFEIGGKWLEIMKEITPDLRRIVFLFNPEAGLPYADKFAQSIAAAARGVELLVSPVRDTAEIERAVVGATSEAKTGIIVNPDAFTVAKRRLIISLMAQYRVQPSTRTNTMLSMVVYCPMGIPTTNYFRERLPTSIGFSRVPSQPIYLFRIPQNLNWSSTKRPPKRLS
jgi:putative ABC transport system substrate-binding protein